MAFTPDMVKEAVPFEITMYDPQTRVEMTGEVRGRLCDFAQVTAPDGRTYEYSWLQVARALNFARPLVV